MELMLLSVLSPAVKCEWGLTPTEEAIITSVSVVVTLYNDGWMDGCMDGWMDGWIDGWMHVCYTWVQLAVIADPRSDVQCN